MASHVSVRRAWLGVGVMSKIDFIRNQRDAAIAKCEVLKAELADIRAKVNALTDAIKAYQEAEEDAVETSDPDAFCDAFDRWDDVQTAIAAIARAKGGE